MLSSHPPGESPKSANERHLLQNKSLFRVAESFSTDVGVRLYVAGFVEPETGQTVWNISNAVCKEMFEVILANFAKSVGTGPNKRIVLQLDNAGWHGPENLAVP